MTADTLGHHQSQLCPFSGHQRAPLPPTPWWWTLDGKVRYRLPNPVSKWQRQGKHRGSSRQGRILPRETKDTVNCARYSGSICIAPSLITWSYIMHKSQMTVLTCILQTPWHMTPCSYLATNNNCWSYIRILSIAISILIVQWNDKHSSSPLLQQIVFSALPLPCKVVDIPHLRQY